MLPVSALRAGLRECLNVGTNVTNGAERRAGIGSRTGAKKVPKPGPPIPLRGDDACFASARAGDARSKSRWPKATIAALCRESAVE
jgi:hypothetical protein